MPWRLVDHTADVAVEGTADDAGSALAEAATAMSYVLTSRDPRNVRPTTEMTMELEAPDLESLAVAFLSEIVWRLESEGVLWLTGGATVEKGPLWTLRASGNAVQYDPDLHGRGQEVKAVTYSGVRVAREGGIWRAFVVLDL